MRFNDDELEEYIVIKAIRDYNLSKLYWIYYFICTIVSISVSTGVSISARIKKMPKGIYSIK